MSKGAKAAIILSSVFLVVVIGLSVFFNLTPAGKATWNSWFHSVQVADDNTNYQTKKHVEDTCRSMISTYNSDRLVYEQYKDSDDKEKRSWAEQAKMRANKTASSYNNFVLKNKYIWKNNVPDDIFMMLSYIE